MRLVFVHGWALGPEMWDWLGPLLGDHAQIRVDLGYFGAPDLPALRTGDILVGHSAGLASALPGEKIPPARIIMASLRENRRELLQLIQSPDSHDAGSQRLIPPQPRSQRRYENLTA